MTLDYKLIVKYPFIIASSFYLSRKMFQLFRPITKDDQKVFYPRNTDDLKNIITKNKNISIKGAGYSQGQQTVSKSGPQINLYDLQKILIVNTNENYITVSANQTWSDIEKELVKHNKYIKIRQASNIFSVGGSISTNVHGWSHRDGTLSNILKSVTYMDPNGKIIKIKPTDEMFKYLVGSYGLFGPIIEAEIFINNNDILVEKGLEMNVSDYVEYYKNNIVNDDTIKMHLFRLSLDKKDSLTKGIVVNYSKHDKQDKNDTKNYVKTEKQYGTYVQRRMLDLAINFQFIRNLYWTYEKRRLIEGPFSIKTSLKHMQVPIRAMHKSYNNMLAEFFVNSTELESFIKDLNKTLLDNNTVLLNASIRPISMNVINGVMAYNTKDSMFAIVLCFDDNKNIPNMISTLIDTCSKNGSSYYLPYQFLADVQQFRKCHPNYNELVVFKNKVDPDNVFSNELYSVYFGTESNKMEELNGEQQIEFSKFLDNILMTVDSKKFNTNSRSYNELLNAVKNSKQGLLYNFKSLYAIQKDLSQQVSDIIPNKKYSGLLEIGYPGRFIKEIANKIDISEPFHVMSDSPKFTDIFEHGFFKKHTKQFPLDYFNTDFENIESNSYDIVTCFVGLHHFQNIDYVIKSINRILKDDGLFILMEHDTYNDDTFKYANMAHSVFNAANNVIILDEMKELRKFKSIDEWSKHITKYGFVKCPKVGIRDGDPTLNTMVSYKKIKNIAKVENKIEYSGRSVKYFTTFLTAIEWRSVDMAEELATFIKNGNPFYVYPYLEQCVTLWKIFWNSYVSAFKHDTFYNIIFSSYTIMNIFILLSNTIGLLTKTIISLPLRTIILKNKTKFQEDLATDYYSDYHNFILKKGFYQYPFFSKIKTIWKSYIDNTDTSVVDILTLLVVSAELLFCGLLCLPVKYFTKEPENLKTIITIETGLLELNRYMDVSNYIRSVSKDSYTFDELKICDQKSVMVEFVTDRNLYVIEGIFKDQLLYTYNDSLTNNIYIKAEIKTADLINVINECFENGILFKFIHDF